MRSNYVVMAAYMYVTAAMRHNDKIKLTEAIEDFLKLFGYSTDRHAVRSLYAAVYRMSSEIKTLERSGEEVAITTMTVSAAQNYLKCLNGTDGRTDDG